MLLMSIDVGGWILMELAGVSSVSMLDRLDLLYNSSSVSKYMPRIPLYRSGTVIRTNSSPGTLLV